MATLPHNEKPHEPNNLLPDLRPTNQRVLLLPVQAGAGREGMNKTEMVSVPRELFKVASCPCCDGSGGFYDGDGEACQCQWCFERNAILAQSAEVVEPAAPAAAATPAVSTACSACRGSGKELNVYGPATPCRDCHAAPPLEAQAELRAILAQPAAGEQAVRWPDHVPCGCGDLYPANSYGAGFIDGRGMCENCDAAASCTSSSTTAHPDASALVEALEKIKSDTLKDDPLDHYDVACDALKAYRAALAGKGGDQ